MDALSAAQQALAQAQLALSRIAPSTTHGQDGSISANASVNGDEGGCAGCSKLEDQLAMERGRARERERRLLKEVKGLRDELSALGWTGNVPVALMEEDDAEAEPAPVVAQRRSLRSDIAPPPAKRLKTDALPPPVPLRVTTIRATAASVSVNGKSKSKSTSTSTSLSKSKAKSKPKPKATSTPQPPAPRISATPSASASVSTRPRPPYVKPGTLRLAANDLPPNWIRRERPDPNLVASAAAAVSLRRGRGRLQTAWGEKLPPFLLDGEPYEYELPWWVNGIEDDDEDQEVEEDEEGREEDEEEGVDEEEGEEEEEEEEPEPGPEPEMSVAEREKEEKRQAALALRREQHRAKRAAEREAAQLKREKRRIKDREAREAKKAKKAAEEAAAAAAAAEDEDEEMVDADSAVSPLTPSSVEPSEMVLEGSPVAFMAWAPPEGSPEI